VRQPRKASITQTDPELTKTDVPEDKLKKIVSFFDKISNPEQIISEIRKNRYSESNLRVSQTYKDDLETENTSCTDSDKKTASCVNLHRKGKKPAAVESDATSQFPYNSPVRCQFCGENFDYR
jgi:chromatin remodeling complex protein RSC6